MKERIVYFIIGIVIFLGAFFLPFAADYFILGELKAGDVWWGIPLMIVTSLVSIGLVAFGAAWALACVFEWDKIKAESQGKVF